MIITVTLNPAMDKTLSIDNFSVGTVNRVQTVRYDIGGKGINVSKVLKNFGVESICTGFLGGIWRDHFETELSSRGISSKFTPIKEGTRTNTKIVDHVNKVYTDVNEPGPEIGSSDLEKFIAQFKILCKPGDIVVLSGGVSQTVPRDIYGTLIKISRYNGAKVILDADGDLLKYAVEERPDIIKPNEHELAKLFGINPENIDDIIAAALKLKEKGISKILVSLGENGSLYVSEKGIFHAEGLKVPVKSTVGAGDSMVAALVFSLLNCFDDLDTLKFANSCGAASVSLEGTEACTLNQVNALLPRVKARKLDKFETRKRP